MNIPLVPASFRKPSDRQYQQWNCWRPEKLESRELSWIGWDGSELHIGAGTRTLLRKTPKRRSARPNVRAERMAAAGCLARGVHDRQRAHRGPGGLPRTVRSRARG